MLDVEIRKLLARFLSNDLSAPELEDQLEDLTWDADDPAAVDVANAALLALAEHQRGDRTDVELRAYLGAISRTYWLDAAPKVVTGSGSSITHRDQSSAASDRWPVEVCA